MDDSSAAESNPDYKPVTVLRRSARLATNEKYCNDSSSEDTGDEVKEKASKDKRRQKSWFSIKLSSRYNKAIRFFYYHADSFHFYLAV